jgi:hypothetical protein
MAASAVEICNSALIKIGANRITALSETSKSAIACNDQYNRLRKEVLRAHPWNFAITWVELAATINTPAADEYTTEFIIPADVLRVLETNLADNLDWEVGYNIDGNKVIFCNDDNLKIKYIKDVTDTTMFDACFDEALSFRLAADLAYHLVQSQSIQQNMFKMYNESVKMARSFDAQEKGQDFVVADQLTVIRR